MAPAQAYDNGRRALLAISSSISPFQASSRTRPDAHHFLVDLYKHGCPADDSTRSQRFDNVVDLALRLGKFTVYREGAGMSRHSHDTRSRRQLGLNRRRSSDRFGVQNTAVFAAANDGVIEGKRAPCKLIHGR